MFLLRQLPSSGHSCGLMQLQFFVLVLFSLLLFAINFLLCFLIILSMFSKQLYPTLILFLSNILLSSLVLGKCFLIRRRNVLPIFVITCTLNGGVNQITFLFLFRLFTFLLGFPAFSSKLILVFTNPLLLRASLYRVLLLSKISLLDELREILVCIECGIFLIIVVGWFDFVLMYLGVWLSLLYGL